MLWIRTKNAQTSRAIKVSVAAAWGLVSVGASAAPAIASKLTTYRTQGTPTALTIARRSFCSNATGSCTTAPSVALNGSNLTISAAAAGSRTATFIATPPDGDYTRSLDADTSGATTFSLHVESLDKGPTGATAATGQRTRLVDCNWTLCRSFDMEILALGTGVAPGQKRPAYAATVRSSPAAILARPRS